MLTKVEIKNFKSIGSSVVTLEPFTALVGPNGAGKSNFVDALRFASECLEPSINLALQNRGGINAVRRRSRGHPANFGMRLYMDFGEEGWADYSFEIAAKKQGAFSVKRERCVMSPSVDGDTFHFEFRDGEFYRRLEGLGDFRISSGRLALSFFLGLEQYERLHDFLANMCFYTITPEKIRELQDPDAGYVLQRDGSNAAAVLREIQRQRPSDYDLLCKYLSLIVPGTTSAEYATAGPKETIHFKQNVGGKTSRVFNTMNISDGTLRVLGVLLAMYQVSAPELVVIEEPEATIHPAASEVLLEILLAGAARRQVLLTTHSPDLLDHKGILDTQLRFVRSEKGQTRIGPIGEGSREAVRDHLYTFGELLRMGELDVDGRFAEEAAQHISLFGKVRSPNQ